MISQIITIIIIRPTKSPINLDKVIFFILDTTPNNVLQEEKTLHLYKLRDLREVEKAE